ncbi:MAG TPA: SIR2 family protein [Bryobacteraceae bacterium]
MSRVIEAALAGRVVVFAGAGISAGPPSSLPGWKPLNAAVFRALRARLEAGIQQFDWLEELERSIEAVRDKDRFPPDYQAQVIEEMCGVRYFQGLQSLDVSVTNAAHDGIAALAAAGAVQAVVTTNFDRLIERALDRSGVAHEAAFDADGYIRLRDRLIDDPAGALPVIKIHGCVSEPLSMIDTLKQRRKRRSRAIEDCLDQFASAYWLFVGFSAQDLETDRDYLGLVSRAPRGAGAMYVVFPGNPSLRPGAEMLKAAYGERGESEVADAGEYFAKLCGGINASVPAVAPAGSRSGADEFKEKLQVWASSLSLAATGLCIAAILEAVGQSEPAVRMLDRLARKEIYEEHGTPDFEALMLQYGRLGAAFGRFIHVPDLNGVLSNASEESMQSLLRLHDTALASRAMGWMPCLFLWIGAGSEATDLTIKTMRGFLFGDWGRFSPNTDEEAVDAWIAATQVCLVIGTPSTTQAILTTFDSILKRAQASGDVVRAGRVIALYMLAMAETSADVPALAAQYDAEFNDVRRVGDGVALGFRAMALARWYTGPGGRETIKQPRDVLTLGRQALLYIDEACGYFRNQGMDPWLVFAGMQQAKAYCDLQDLDAVAKALDQIQPVLDRFPVFDSHVHETVGEIQFAIGNKHAAESFEKAIQAAEQTGLELRKKMLEERYGPSKESAANN